MPGRASVSSRLTGGGRGGELKLEIASSEINSLISQVRGYSSAAKAAVQKVLDKYADLMYQEAFRLCPEDTGNLRASITVVLDELAYVIFTDVTYAQFVEYGTVKMAAQPFMLPAFLRYKDKLYSEIKDAMLKTRR